MQLPRAVEQTRGLVEVLGRIGRGGLRHQRLDLLVGHFRDVLQRLFGVVGEQHVFRCQVLRPGVKQIALLFRGLAKVQQPLRFGLLCFQLRVRGVRCGGNGDGTGEERGESEPANAVVVAHLGSHNAYG